MVDVAFVSLNLSHFYTNEILSRFLSHINFAGVTVGS